MQYLCKLYKTLLNELIKIRKKLTKMETELMFLDFYSVPWSQLEHITYDL